MDSIKARNASYRNELFRHLDGIAIAPVAYELHVQGVLKHIIEAKSCALQDLTSQFNANDGYLNVAIRLIASQGWLDYQVDNATEEISIRANNKSEVAFSHAEHYGEVVSLMKFFPKSIIHENLRKNHSMFGMA